MLCVCVLFCGVVQAPTMKSIHSLAGILLVLGFVQSSWQVPLLEADDSSRYRNPTSSNKKLYFFVPVYQLSVKMLHRTLSMGKKVDRFNPLYIHSTIILNINYKLMSMTYQNNYYIVLDFFKSGESIPLELSFKNM